MPLPAHIAERIRSIVASTSTNGYHIDSEAARYGGVALMGTIGAVWLLRPDGTLWDVDDDSGRLLAPLASEWHHAALVCGAERYPWLAELIPRRPQDAVSCSVCRGGGWLQVGGSSLGKGVFCPECQVRGWQSGV
jgi:hypothetical protein